LLQATAITRTVPVKAGMAKLTSAVPSAPTVTMPDYLALGALHAVDQLAVKVADLGRELALAEIIGVGIRHFVIGEVENADVDGRDDDARLLACAEARKLDRSAERRFRPDQRRQIHGDGNGVRLLVDAEPLHADGAAWHALLGLVERAPQGGEHIGAGAPILTDGERQLDETRLHIGG
jgi:hypothetical protein